MQEKNEKNLPNREIGARLSYLQRLLGLKIGQMANLIEIDRRSLSRLFAGHPPSTTTLDKIIENLGTSREYILHGVGQALISNPNSQNKFAQCPACGVHLNVSLTIHKKTENGGL